MTDSSAQTQPEPPWLRFALLGGLLAGFGLRLFRLGAESLWYDETVSVYLARKPLAEMIAHTAGDIHPPGYYGLLHVWQGISHPTLAHGLEFLFAWPSLWAGMVVVALLYPIGKRLVGRPAALTAVWLAAVNPFHLWYGQEVRMYTIGAALGLTCLWALLRFFDRDRWAWVWLGVYVIAASAGLYTLYYFAFTLIGLNAVALVEIFRRTRDNSSSRGRSALAWFSAQAAVLLLWLPWLPVFVRQALDPPVPPWREPWPSLQAFLATLSETLGALVIGQTPPGGRMWPFALVAVAGVAVFALQPTEKDPARNGRGPLLVYLFVPIGLLYFLTAFVTPLYHVRYVFVYAPVFMLMLGGALMQLRRFGRPATAFALVLFIGLSSWGLYEFWFNPRYRADDHRSAVADLARNWRPGDGILVNAGWVYPALEVYWPTELIGPLASRPPAIGWSGRFTDHAAALHAEETESGTSANPAVVIARTGSVDGAPSLGWSDPASDFFAVSTADTEEALKAMANAHPRLWHYRLYDTVSDPTGVIRAWLEENMTLNQDLPYAGRDYLRVQRYDNPVTRFGEDDMIPVDARFGDALALVGRMPHTAVDAGEMLYIDLIWEALPGIAELDTDLSVSLRLYEYDSDLLLTQQDVAPRPPTSAWQVGEIVSQRYALAVPVSAKPLRYAIEVIVYRQDTGEPLTPAGDEQRIIASQRWRIGLTDVFKPPAPPEIPARIARFDYIDLVHIALDRTTSGVDGEFRAELVWHPQPSPYRDNYDVVIELRDGTGRPVAAWRQVAGGPNYPSVHWPEGFPLREVRLMPLSNQAPPGEYRVTLRLERTSDGLPIPAGTGPLGRLDFVEIGTLTLY